MNVDRLNAISYTYGLSFCVPTIIINPLSESFSYRGEGSCKTCSLRPSSYSSRSKSRHLGEHYAVVPKENFVFLKCKSCLRVGIPLVIIQKGKHLKISAYKGNEHIDEHGNGGNGSNALKSSVKMSYPLKETEETLMESPRTKSIPISYSSQDETLTRFLSMHNLLKNWLPLLPVLPPKIAVEQHMEVPSSIEISEAQCLGERKGRSEILKAVCGYFINLDATITIPLLIFVPYFLAVSFLYGAEVSKELIPLWLLGPLVVALYVKMLRGIFALYSFSFNQTAKLVKNVPAYIVRGQLKEDIRARFLQPLVDIRNLDYKELHLDVLVWPYYYRTIRVLKRTKFI